MHSPPRREGIRPEMPVDPHDHGRHRHDPHRRRFPHFHIIRDLFALIGLGTVIVYAVRYAIIPLLILLQNLGGGSI